MSRKRKQQVNTRSGVQRKNTKKSSKKIIKPRTKEYHLKTDPPTCKVTFRLSKKEVPEAEEVSIVGDFNDWKIGETPMEKLKNGDFKVTLSLPCNREYRFRYLINPHISQDDPCADECISLSYQCEE
jgi:1,4-alpha-glucan branching enzyme